jgi:hypothetical protein
VEVFDGNGKYQAEWHNMIPPAASMWRGASPRSPSLANWARRR